MIMFAVSTEKYEIKESTGEKNQFVQIKKSKIPQTNKRKNDSRSVTPE